MGRREDFYTGYIAWREEAYRNTKRGYDPFTEKYERNLLITEQKISIEIDSRWIEMFEDCFPYIENCIRESRSFLRKDDELINIQLANKIDVNGTLGYMTEHTNIIDDYDELASNVRPSQLINSFYESTYDIYENRFIYTLVNLCNDFISDTFDSLERLLGKHYYKIYFDYRKFERFQDVDKNSSFSLNYDKTKEELARQETALPDFVRIRKLKEMLRDFFDTDLIRQLKGVKYVTAPLTMTNVLQKNTNFKKAVDLWNFLLAYDGDKIKIIKEEVSVEHPERFEDDFYELSTINDNLTRIMLDENYRKKMRGDYRARLEAKIKKEKEQKEEQKRGIKKYVREAVARQSAKDKEIYGKKIALLEKEISLYRIAADKELNDAVDEFKMQARREQSERYEFEAEYRLKYAQDIESLKQGFEVQNQAIIERSEAEKKKFLSEENKKYEMAETAYKKELARINTAHAGEIKKLVANQEQEIRRLNKEHANELSSIKSEFETEKASIINDYSSQIDALNVKYDNDTAALNLKYDTDVAALNLKYDTDVAALNLKYETDMSALTHSYETQLADQKETLEKQFTDMRDSYENTLSELKVNHANEISSIKETHASELTAMRTQLVEEREKLVNQYEETLAKNNNEHQKKVQTLTEDYDNRIKRWKAMFLKVLKSRTKAIERVKDKSEKAYSALETQKNNLETKISKIAEDHKTEIKRVRDDNAQEIELLKVSHAQKISNLEKKRIDDISSTEAIFTDKLAKLSDEKSKQKEGFAREKDELVDRISRMNEDFKLELKRIRENKTKETQELKSTQAEKLAELKKRRSEEISNLQVEFANKLAKMQKGFEEEKKVKEAEWAKMLETQKEQADKRFASEHNNMMSKIDELKKEYESIIAVNESKKNDEIFKLNKKHTETIDEMEKNHAQILESIRKENDKKQQAYADENEKLKKQIQKLQLDIEKEKSEKPKKTGWRVPWKKKDE